MYQLIDPFLLFSMKFIHDESSLRNWPAYYDTPSYNAWRGIAFETVCLCHLPQINQALSLMSMSTKEFPWNSSVSSSGAQIDLVIERPDKLTYVCEMTCTNNAFTINHAYEEDLQHKIEVFKEESKTKNSVQLVMIASAGLKTNAHSGIISKTVNGDDLFI